MRSIRSTRSLLLTSVVIKHLIRLYCLHIYIRFSSMKNLQKLAKLSNMYIGNRQYFISLLSNMYIGNRQYFISLSIYKSIYLSIYLFIFISVHLSIYRSPWSIHLYIFLPIQIYLSPSLSCLALTIGSIL